MSKNVGQSLRCLQRLIHQKVEVLKVESKDDLSLVKINLETGRSHQIRVQFSSRKNIKKEENA